MATIIGGNVTLDDLLLANNVQYTYVNSFVGESQVSVQLLAANPNRVKAYLINRSNKSMYINFDSAATTNHIKIKKDSTLEIKINGVINGIWKNGANSGVYIIEESS